MRNALLLSFLVVGCAAPFDGRAVLLSRRGHGDYEKATFSFEHGTRDGSTGLVRNDWDVEFGNGQDVFSVTMVVDDRSRIQDLGPLTWAELGDTDLPDLPAYPQPTREEPVPAVVGHMYLVHTADRDSNLLAVFRVEELVPGDSVSITWKRLPNA